MTAVVQRVLNAEVRIDGELVGKCGNGLMILLGVAAGDAEADAVALAEKLLKFRIFSDENGKMNLSVKDISGQALVVSNFTLNANYAHGNRPDYFNSAPPKEANELYEFFKSRLTDLGVPNQSGVFGADMRTEMSTDGPVTIVMDSDVLLKR